MVTADVLVRDTNPSVGHSIKVEWSELGEGICGDYDPGELDDVELLRFDISRWMGDHWEDVEDASYCTQVPVSATSEQRATGLKMIMDAIYERASSGQSIKRLCEELSWISLAVIAGGPLEKRLVL